VAHAEIGRELLLERIDLGPEDVAAAARHTLERLAQAVVIGRETAGK
jgi:hypothetical protein